MLKFSFTAPNRLTTMVYKNFKYTKHLPQLDASADIQGTTDAAAAKK